MVDVYVNECGQPGCVCVLVYVYVCEFEHETRQREVRTKNIDYITKVSYGIYGTRATERERESEEANRVEMRL